MKDGERSEPRKFCHIIVCIMHIHPCKIDRFDGKQESLSEGVLPPKAGKFTPLGGNYPQVKNH
jgi:hypothetical protein